MISILHPWYVIFRLRLKRNSFFFFSQWLKTDLFLKYHHMGEVHLEISRKKYRLLCVSFHCLNRDTMSGFRSLLTHQDIPTTWQPPASGLLLLSWSQTDWWYSLNCLKCHFHSSFWSFCLSYIVLPVTEIYDFTAASVILSLLCWLSTIPLLRPSSLVFHQVCSSVHFSPFSFFFSTAIDVIAVVWLWEETLRGTVTLPIPSSHPTRFSWFL